MAKKTNMSREEMGYKPYVNITPQGIQNDVAFFNPKSMSGTYTPGVAGPGTAWRDVIDKYNEKPQLDLNNLMQRSLAMAAAKQIANQAPESSYQAGRAKMDDLIRGLVASGGNIAAVNAANQARANIGQAVSGDVANKGLGYQSSGLGAMANIAGGDIGTLGAIQDYSNKAKALKSDLYKTALHDKQLGQTENQAILDYLYEIDRQRRMYNERLAQEDYRQNQADKATVSSIPVFGGLVSLAL